MKILERIKKLCKAKGISVYQLEDQIDIGRNTIYQWNKRTPSADKLQKVADYFDVSVDYILGREKEVSSKVSELSDDTLIMTLDGKEVSAADREVIIAAARAVIAQREANQKDK